MIDDELWIAAYRRSFPGYAVELTEIGSGRQVLIPTDRFRPYPHRVYGDGAGGLVTMQPPMHLAPGARHPTALGDPDVSPDARHVKLAAVSEGLVERKRPQVYFSLLGE